MSSSVASRSRFLAVLGELGCSVVSAAVAAAALSCLVDSGDASAQAEEQARGKAG